MQTTNTTKSKGLAFVKRRFRRGLSLIEIMIAIGVTALLAAVGIFIANGVMQKGRLNTGQANARCLTEYVANVKAVCTPTNGASVTGASDMADLISAATAGVTGPTGPLQVRFPGAAPTAANYTWSAATGVVSFNGSATSDLEP